MYSTSFSLSPGSAEGFSLAEKAISSASKSGRWVLLKNVHLAPQWLVMLEKKLHSITPHANFRLFLTMEINPKVRAKNICSTFCYCLFFITTMTLEHIALVLALTAAKNNYCLVMYRYLSTCCVLLASLRSSLLPV